MPSGALRLEVDGIGQVRLPVRPAQAKKLCGVARPAHFVHREETILDPAVRDTWEISPDLVSLGGPSWALALEGALTELADELGVPAGNRLEAELHALLVYGPGQFFVPVRSWWLIPDHAARRSSRRARWLVRRRSSGVPVQ